MFSIAGKVKTPRMGSFSLSKAEKEALSLRYGLPSPNLGLLHSEAMCMESGDMIQWLDTSLTYM